MNFLPKTVDSQFLVRVIRNEVGSEEREFFEKWLEESEANKEEFSSVLLLWDSFQYSHLPSLPQKEEQWEKIESAIYEHQPEPAPSDLSFPDNYSSINPHHLSSKKNPAVTWFYRIAATAVIFLSVIFIIESGRTPGHAVQNQEVISPVTPIKYYTVSTEKGQRATLTLPDGSVIQLNSDSKLIYPNYFGAESREVEFEGEGYFKIYPNKSKPFKVNCRNTTTVVTGTEFNIRNRGTGFRVTVVEGSVKTFNSSSKSAEGVSVERGQTVMLKSSGKFSHPVKADMNHFLAWRHNKVSFSKTPLYEAAAEIQRCYNNIKVNILTDSIKNKTITGVFDTNSLDDILSVMSFTLDIRVSRKGNQIFFQ